MQEIAQPSPQPTASFQCELDSAWTALLLGNLKRSPRGARVITGSVWNGITDTFAHSVAGHFRFSVARRIGAPHTI